MIYQQHVPASSAPRICTAVAMLAAGLVTGSCGARNTDEILRGGVPARTDLPLATSLPVESVRTVSRRSFGWRVIYQPGSAPTDADQRAASALCGLEKRAVSRIEPVAMISPADDPGTRKIDIICA